MLSIQGKIYHIRETKLINEKYYAREFILQVVTDTGYHCHYIKFCLSNGLVDLIDRFKQGDNVTVFFRLTGKFVPEKNDAYNKLSVTSITPNYEN